MRGQSGLWRLWAAAAAALLAGERGRAAAAAAPAAAAAAGAAAEAAAAAAAVTELEWDGRIVALGDLHGDAANTLLLLQALGVVDSSSKWAAGSSTLLLQTGDIVDRGPDGKLLYELFSQWQQQAQQQGSKVLQLLGNHDAMNLCGDFRYAHPAETAQFGGLAGRRRAFSAAGFYGSLLLQFSAAAKVNGIVFSHAGVSPQFAALGLQQLQQLLAAELRDGCKLQHEKQRRAGGPLGLGAPPRGPPGGPPLFASGAEGPLWSRLYTLGPPEEACAALQQALLLLQGELMVVGHTVQQSLQIESRCSGLLLQIDTGISRFVADSPKALEVTPQGQLFEVSVHRSSSSSSSSKPRVTRRRLPAPPLSFYLRKQQQQQQQQQRGQRERGGAREAAAAEAAAAAAAAAAAEAGTVEAEAAAAADEL